MATYEWPLVTLCLLVLTTTSINSGTTDVQENNNDTTRHLPANDTAMGDMPRILFEVGDLFGGGSMEAGGAAQRPIGIVAQVQPMGSGTLHSEHQRPCPQGNCHHQQHGQERSHDGHDNSGSDQSENSDTPRSGNRGSYHRYRSSSDSSSNSDESDRSDHSSSGNSGRDRSSDDDSRDEEHHHSSSQYHDSGSQEGGTGRVNKCQGNFPPDLWLTRGYKQPCGVEGVQCNKCRNPLYRELDGSCNHELGFGAVRTPFVRIHKARYADGHSKVVKFTTSGHLPSARALSVALFKDQDRPEVYNALSLIQWSQLVSHDTAFQNDKTQLDGSSYECCRQKDEDEEEVSRASVEAYCLPIRLPMDDPFYSKHKQRCRNFVRSRWAKCPSRSKREDEEQGIDSPIDEDMERRVRWGHDPRAVNQINHVTSFMDCSFIYGSDDERGALLRAGKGGLLKTREVTRDSDNKYGKKKRSARPSEEENGDTNESEDDSNSEESEDSDESDDNSEDASTTNEPQEENEEGSGSGQEQGSGSGQEQGSGSGSGQEQGSGSGQEQGSGSGSGQEQGSGSEEEQGSGSGSGQEQGSGSGQEQGSGSGQEQGSGSGQEEGSASSSKDEEDGAVLAGGGGSGGVDDDESVSSEESSSSSEVKGEEFLPFLDQYDPFCRERSSNRDVCYISGDDRANVHVWLTSLHVLFHREHNRLARRLNDIHPDWGDKRLFQEARRIVIALMQRITYGHYLPKIVGKKILKRMDLLLGSRALGSYDGRVNPSTMNEFSTGAFRYLHSLIQGKIETQGEGRCPMKTYSLSDFFFHSTVLEKPDFLTSVFRGMTNQPAQSADHFVTKEVTNLLYKVKKSFGDDLISRDIQRGRDHGLPSYNDVRHLCGLPKALDFEDFQDVIPKKNINSLKKLYRSANDVDFLVGGYFEQHCVDGDDSGILGPTFGCIVAEQFFRWRKGDRYFFDHAEGPGRFTKAQYKAIMKVSLATLLCENLDGLEYIQPDPFQIVSNRNPLMSCKDIPRLNLRPWRDHHPKKNCEERREGTTTTAAGGIGS